MSILFPVFPQLKSGGNKKQPMFTGLFPAFPLFPLKFCEWCSATGTVGCMPDTFEAILEDEGFRIVDGLVSGLVLKDDARQFSREYPALRGSKSK
jgi:hypothetical protein